MSHIHTDGSTILFQIIGKLLIHRETLKAVYCGKISNTHKSKIDVMAIADHKRQYQVEASAKVTCIVLVNFLGWVNPEDTEKTAKVSLQRMVYT